MRRENPYFGFKKDRAKTYALWERFNSGLVAVEELHDPYERLLIEDWHRCARLGLDVHKKVGERLGDEELFAHLEGGRQLLDIARPVIDRIGGCLSDVPGILILADSSGLILHIAGDKEVRVLAAERSGIVEGSCWSEAVAGTNGVGTALSKRRPVHVYSAEHYCEGWHAWTCAATPILAPGGKLCGAIDFTTTDKNYRDQAMALTCSLANAIQADLQLVFQLERNFLLQHYQKFERRNATESLICVDGRGRLVRSSSASAGRRFAELGAQGMAGSPMVRDMIPVIMPGNGRRAGTIYVVGDLRGAVEPGSRAAAESAMPRTPTQLRRSPPPAAPVEAPPSAAAGGLARVEANEALAEHQIIFDNAIVGICQTRQRIIVRCNQRFEEMFGYSPGELTNQSIRILYPSSESFDQIGQSGYEHLQIHHTYSDERVMRRRDGELFWCNVAGKTLDPANPARNAIWIFQDISKRKRAEEALQRAHERLELRVQERTAELRQAYDTLRAEMEMRQVAEQALIASREKYRVLFETFPIGLSITDEQGDVIEINRSLSRMTSQATQAALTRDLKIAGACVINPDGTPQAREQLPSFRALREQRAVHDAELGVRYASGKVRWFNVTAAPIPVKGYGVVIAHTEITERKRSEELERQQRSDLARVSRLNTMGEMAAALAHELGQPLSSTLNYLHGCQLRLDDGQYDKELFRSAISQAIHHAEQAGGIVKHIRQFVRRHEPETVLTDINALIREMAAFLEFELHEYGTGLCLSLAEGLPAVLLDPLEIKQVIVNLIKNGIDAMSELPKEQRLLEVSTRPRGRQWVEVEVADRGPGITTKDSTHIFDAFFTTKHNGLGLGLAICRTIVESHGGRITAARNVRSGATFSFRLPIRTGAS